MFNLDSDMESRDCYKRRSRLYSYATTRSKNTNCEPRNAALTDPLSLFCSRNPHAILCRALTDPSVVNFLT